MAELVKKQRTLLILDGLEPLQYPPGEMEGRLKDPGLQCLLRELARQNPGLCIITTRLPVDELKDFVGTLVEHIELEHLSPEAGAKLLEKLGVKGTNYELRQAVSEFDGHALALTLLGRYLAVVYNGDIRQRDKIAKLTKEKEKGGHARRVMESYEKWFEGRRGLRWLRWFKDKPDLNILRIMGLFDRPAEGGAIEALRARPAIKGLTSELQKLSYEDWQYAVHNLRSARLLAGEDLYSPDTLDCHPLVREHFGEKLKESNPGAWKEAHSRLYEYYKSHAKEYPDTIEEMVPLYAAVAHGCQAGRHQETLDEVYRRRIHRGDEYFSVYTFGAFGAELAALSGFFNPPWQQLVAGLTESAKAFVMRQTGYCLRALGRLAEAAQRIQAALDGHIAEDDWKNAAIDAVLLTNVYLYSGHLAKALAYAQRGVCLVDHSNNTLQKLHNRWVLVYPLYQMGRVKEAEALFREAEKMPQAWKEREYPVLYANAVFRYCDLLLSQGKYHEVLIRTKKAIQMVTQAPRNLFAIALNHLSLGRAYLMQMQREGIDASSRATEHLNLAMNSLRQAGRQDELPRGLLARAELYRVQCEFEQAKVDLEEAMLIAERVGTRLHEADCHLEYARLYLAMSKKDKARESLATAKGMIEEMGYHRRDNEVKDLEEQLKGAL